MTTLLITAASAVVIFVVMSPIIDWYQKAKKEMEDADRD